MEPELLNELQMLCKDMYEASLTNEIASHTLLQKYVAHLNSILRKNGTGQSVADLVKEWVEVGQGKFYSSHMFAELGLTTRADKKAADMALRRIAKRGIVVECGEQRGCWRTVTNGITELDWEQADIEDVIPLKWPLGLEQYFTLYPTNVIVCAGEKNAGKTSFMLNLAYLNAESKLPIVYFSSEMAAQELKVRLSLFPSQEPFKRVKFFPLEYHSLTDVIQPDAINIVDFMEVDEEFWLVGKKIRQMWERLTTGIILVAVQKDPDAKLGRGKAFSTEKARVYITMTKKQVMTLVEVKNYKGAKKPDGLVISYQFEKNALLTRKTIQQPALSNVKKFESPRPPENLYD